MRNSYDQDSWNAHYSIRNIRRQPLSALGCNDPIDTAPLKLRLLSRVLLVPRAYCSGKRVCHEARLQSGVHDSGGIAGGGGRDVGRTRGQLSCGAKGKKTPHLVKAQARVQRYRYSVLSGQDFSKLLGVYETHNSIFR